MGRVSCGVCLSWGELVSRGFVMGWVCLEWVCRGKK